MSKIISIEPAIDPNARPTFLLDWELTLKCNLDCSYCESTGPFRYHDNTTEHPPLHECLDTIDFMYQYVDLYMQQKPKWNRAVVLNIYGGESLFHPDIVEILQAIRSKHQAYKQHWPLIVTCTTNAVVGHNRMTQVIEYIDQFTVSYHAESLPKQKKQVLDNLSLLVEHGKKVKCIVLMHSNFDYWPELEQVIDFCKHNDIQYLPRHLDGDVNANYNSQQIKWFQNLWQTKTPIQSVTVQKELTKQVSQNLEAGGNLAKTGRACCGGRLLCVNEDLTKPVFYVPNNNFQGWSCSVNWYFLYVKQVTKEIFSNKDCMMNFDGGIGPIGSLSNPSRLINQLKQWVQDKKMPVIECKKSRCSCGICAPKSQDKKSFFKVMKKQILDVDVFDSIEKS